MRAALVVLVIAALARIARASPTSAEELYTDGQAAYDRADYLTAIAKWRESYQLSGESGLLFNLAQALRLSGDCAGALATYRRFLAADPTADQHDLAVDLARELDRTCGDHAPVAPASVPQPAAIVASPVNLIDPRNDPTAAGARPGRTLKIAGLVTEGAGLTTITTGLVLGHHGQILGDEVTRACRTSCDWAGQKDKDAAGRRDVAIGRVLDGVGVAAVVGGAILYYTGVRQDGITVAPNPRESGASVTWSGTW